MQRALTASRARRSSGTVLAQQGEDASGSKNVMNQSQGRPAAPEDGPAKAPEELRTLAAWYRDYTERAGSTLVWDYRLSTAEDLERQASALELQVNRFQ